MQNDAQILNYSNYSIFELFFLEIGEIFGHVRIPILYMKEFLKSMDNFF